MAGRSSVRNLPLLLTLLFIIGCATPRLQVAVAPQAPPRLFDTHAVMADGAVLPLSRWGPRDGAAQAVVLALHGFNDYRNAFTTLGPSLARRGIITYAYDQRGFGQTVETGIWAGEERLVDDLETMVRLLAAHHPQLPLFLFGESMGAAVILAALGNDAPPRVAGAALSAPAVWGGPLLNPLQRGILWLAAHSVPDLRLTGESLRILATDNLEVLRALASDPLVIKRTRIDAVYGLARLMDSAYRAAHHVQRPLLVLYGAHDQVIPREAILAMTARLPSLGNGQRLAYYPRGYHLLTRDRNAESVLRDVADWILSPQGPLRHELRHAAWRAALQAPCSRRDGRGNRGSRAP